MTGIQMTFDGDIVHNDTPWFDRVKGWAGDRGLIENSNPAKQFAKLTEEVEELHDAIVGMTANKAPRDEAAAKVDHLSKKLEALEAERNIALLAKDEKLDAELRDQIASEREALSVWSETHEKHKEAYTEARREFIDACGDCTVVLSIMLAQEGLTLDNAKESAWLEIKDRKGHMNADGIFVKEN
jgi:DNA gyrase/topoisomerase IV subunit A